MVEGEAVNPTHRLGSVIYALDSISISLADHRGVSKEDRLDSETKVIDDITSSSLPDHRDVSKEDPLDSETKAIDNITSGITRLAEHHGFPNPQDVGQMKLLSRLEAVERRLRYWQNARFTSSAHIDSGAGHGSQACLDGTRGSVLQQIECWVNDPSSPPIYWLNGLAGTGKSAIAWTIADKFSKASLFCSRDPNDPDRGKAQLIIIALASQLALKDSKFLSEFKKEVSSDVTNCTQKYQMSRLIINPIKKSGIENPVIVIDGLDECGDEETISNILTIIGDSADDMRNLDLKFLITSRPETRIYHYLRQAVSKGNVRTFSLHEVGSSEVNEDMQLFFKHELLKHNPSRGRMNDWPSAGALNLLSQRTAGLFSYASEIVRSINHHFETSRDQLDLQWLLDNISLDSLYTPIMDSAKNDSRLSNLDNPRSILGAVALAPSPITPSTIAKLLGIGLREVLHHLQKFEALFIVKDDDSPIQPLHKSVSTFLTNPSKSDQWFYICPRTHHKKFFVECLKLIIEMKKGRKFCPVVTMPREKNEKSINAALLYACGSLHKHVTSGMLTDYTPPLRFELEAVSQPMTDGPPKVRGPGNNRFQGALKGFWHLDKILKR